MTRLDEHRSICLSPLARDTAKEAGAAYLGGDNGYFIYEVNDSPLANGISVLAKVVSMDAAFRLVELWKGKPEAMSKEDQEPLHTAHRRALSASH